MLFYKFQRYSQIINIPHRDNLDAKPILIYGAGTAGNELYHSIQQNPNIRVVGFSLIILKLKGAN